MADYTPVKSSYQIVKERMETFYSKKDVNKLTDDEIDKIVKRVYDELKKIPLNEKNINRNSVL